MILHFAIATAMTMDAAAFKCVLCSAVLAMVVTMVLCVPIDPYK
jgi:hypothetical protein